jgi:BMFP domain-containing protein YqiC
MQKKNIFKRIAMLCMALLVVVFVGGWLVPDIASSQQEQSRINALEADLYRIESRLNRIEAQLTQLRRGDSPRTPATPHRINSGQKRPQLSREQMFDRLATLVIELREQIKQLEARVSKLEARPAPSKIN